MVSDVLFEAAQDIKENLYNGAIQYSNSTFKRIERLKNEMDVNRAYLDSFTNMPFFIFRIWHFIQVRKANNAALKEILNEA